MKHYFLVSPGKSTETPTLPGNGRHYLNERNSDKYESHY